MIALMLPLFLFAEPFWVNRTPEQWSDAEVQTLLSSSPWAQAMDGPAPEMPSIQIFLSTAGPIALAEKEQERRTAARRRPGTAAAENAEFRLWMEDNRATQIVVAVRLQSNRGFLDEREVKRMENESTMRAGKKTIKLTGSFPPSESDPYLRLAFPRQVDPADKSLIFNLYLPGVPAPYRNAEFKLKDMVVNGKLEL